MYYMIYFFLILIGLANAQLNFNNDGTFKALLFSDLHYDDLDQTCSALTPLQSKYPCSNSNTTFYMTKVIENENPDLIILLGDNTDWSSNNTNHSVEEAVKPIIDSEIPWTTVLGNHDEQGTLTRDRLIPLYNSLRNFIYIDKILGIHGYGNHYIRVNDFMLWFFDSGDYFKIGNKSLGYDWIHLSQIEWFKNNRLSNNNGLAFFHIPLIEYERAVLNTSNIIGTYGEAICDSHINGGLYSAIRNSGVRATFCGHDHKNDFCANYYGINLCYNGGSGFHAYGEPGFDRRSRVISIEDNGNKVFTWKRLYNSNLTKIDYQELL